MNTSGAVESSYRLATSSWGDEEIAAMLRVIDSRQFTMGKEVRELEDAFAEFHGVPHCVMVNSGSSANLLAVAAATLIERPLLIPGDEVLVPAVSWATTYYPYHQYGCSLRFVDIDRDTLNVDLNLLEEAITEKTKAISLVNLLGNPNDFRTVKAIAERAGLAVIEDNCESLGAEAEGVKAGTAGVLGTFSSFFSHHMSTMEGGFVICRDEELYHVLLSIRAHGWTRDLPAENRVMGRKESDPFQESFNFVLPGYNVRPLELEGAVGLVQLGKLRHFLEVRRSNAEYFKREMSRFPELRTQSETGNSSWFGFSVVVESERVTRKEVLGELGRAGVEYRPIVGGNFARKRVVERMKHSVFGELKVAEEVERNGFFVGNQEVDLRGAIDRMLTVFEDLGLCAC